MDMSIRVLATDGDTMTESTFGDFLAANDGGVWDAREACEIHCDLLDGKVYQGGGGAGCPWWIARADRRDALVLQVGDWLWDDAGMKGKALSAASGGGAMGLTPDSVRSTPEWRRLNRSYQEAHAALRTFNGRFPAPKMTRAERMARAKARRA